MFGGYPQAASECFTGTVLMRLLTVVPCLITQLHIHMSQISPSTVGITRGRPNPHLAPTRTGGSAIRVLGECEVGARFGHLPADTPV